MLFRSPTPVPMMTPKTMRAPLPAPLVASARAKQLASFSITTGKPRRRARSAGRSRPFRHSVFEFFIKPVRLDSAPGVPMPITRALGARVRSSSARRPVVSMMWS